jgi:hypothetical protein
MAAKAPASSNVTEPANTPGAVPTPPPALLWIEDTDPGPPFTVEISANRATQDPLVPQSVTYKITGLVRNDGDRTFSVSAINVTFFDAEGFRGSFHRAPGRGRMGGGEWVWHGQTEADFACLLLAPGQDCPFDVEITAQNMASFLVHPDAAPTDRESAPVALSNVKVVNDETRFVRITGLATNNNPFEVKNVIVSGVLLDASGHMVSLGSTFVLETDIGPGQTVDFDLRITYAPFVQHRLYAQAEREW